jgi:hypothetical protein
VGVLMLTLWLARCLLHFVGWKLFVIEAPALMLLLRTPRRSKASQQTPLLTRRRRNWPGLGLILEPTNLVQLNLWRSANPSHLEGQRTDCLLQQTLEPIRWSCGAFGG